MVFFCLISYNKLFFYFIDWFLLFLLKDLLDRYAACKTAKEVLAVQDEFLATEEKEEKEKENREMDLPPTYSSSSEDDEEEGWAGLLVLWKLLLMFVE